MRMGNDGLYLCFLYIRSSCAALERLEMGTLGLETGAMGHCCVLSLSIALVERMKDLGKWASWEILAHYLNHERILAGGLR